MTIQSLKICPKLVEKTLTNDAQACWQIWEVYHRKRWQIWSKGEKSCFVANPRVLKDNHIGFTAFPKVKQIKRSHTSATKTHPFSDKEMFSCRTAAASMCVAPFWSSQPPLPAAAGAPILRDSETLLRWSLLSPLWALLPHSALTTEQNSPKPRPFPGIIFSLVLQLIHGGSEASQTWCCPAKLPSCGYHSDLAAAAEHKGSTAKTYPACIGWTIGLPFPCLCLVNRSKPSALK